MHGIWARVLAVATSENYDEEIFMQISILLADWLNNWNKTFTATIAKQLIAYFSGPTWILFKPSFLLHN